MIKNWNAFNESLETGICTCKVPPMGADGLEGFLEKEEYRYELKVDKKGKDYYKIYHTDDYAETCGTKTFKKYFNIKQTLK